MLLPGRDRAHRPVGPPVYEDVRQALGFSSAAGVEGVSAAAPVFAWVGRVVCKHVLRVKGCVSMTVSIRLTAEEEERLAGLARRTGRSRSFYVRAALREYLTDLEDAFAADDAINAFEAAGLRSRPLAVLEAEYGL